MPALMKASTFITAHYRDRTRHLTLTGQRSYVTEATYGLPVPSPYGKPPGNTPEAHELTSLTKRRCIVTEFKVGLYMKISS